MNMKPVYFEEQKNDLIEAFEKASQLRVLALTRSTLGDVDIDGIEQFLDRVEEKLIGMSKAHHATSVGAELRERPKLAVIPGRLAGSVS